MSLVNGTISTASSFHLAGIPGLEAFHIWFAAPLTAMYIVTLIGNCTLLLAIRTALSLHKPMYLLVSFLSFSDLVLSSSILPKMLANFWGNDGEISFSACFFQMYLLHVFAGVESGILTAMAFDRCVAVCNPLRYSTIVTHPLIANIGGACLARAAFSVLPQSLLAMRLPFCNRHIAHSFCEHIAVVKLSCADITLNSRYGLVTTLTFGAMDLAAIGASYALIFRAIMHLPRKDRFKVFSTCIAHVIVMSFFFIPIFSSLAMHRFQNTIPPYVHILVANAYLLLPPVANPLTYGVNMAEIRQGVRQMFLKAKSRLLLCG
ncbi:olfactory receptor 52J3-like [Ambystoma mexicanum]|uniref:olfactory receptor 52J3-like n=1 Tax=Ambystoma mexicanum TaxID=8296 RepID=UPI0037E908AC